MRFPKVLVTTAALAFSLAPVAAPAQEAQGDSDQAQATTLSSLPDPVRQTVERLAEGGQVVKVQQMKEDGKQRYLAWIKKGDEKFGSVLDESGKVIRYEKSQSEKKGDKK